MSEVREKANGARAVADIKPGDENLGRYKTAEAKARALANLKAPFAIGNPGGARPRTKDRSLLIIEVRKQLRQRVQQDPERRTWAALITSAMIRSAVRGNAWAAKWLSEMSGGFPDPKEAERPPKVVLMINRNQERDFDAEGVVIDGTAIPRLTN